jgi:hypothetical protein
MNINQGGGKSIPPAVSTAILVLVAGLCILGFYRFLVGSDTVPTGRYIDAAKYWMEQGPRGRLQMQGLTPAQIDAKIAAMWRNGELKLPPGQPPKDWYATIDGKIVIVNPKAAGGGKPD